MTDGAFGATPLVYARHFHAALRATAPSVSKRDQRTYDALRHKIRRSRGHLQGGEADGAAPAAALPDEPASSAGGLPPAGGAYGAAEPGGGSDGPKPMEND